MPVLLVTKLKFKNTHGVCRKKLVDKHGVDGISELLIDNAWTCGWHIANVWNDVRA